MKLTLQQIKEHIESIGYKVISNKYVDATTNLDLICPQGHKCQISWSRFTTGKHRCRKCRTAASASNRKNNIEELKQIAIKKGYKIKSTIYKNAKTKLTFICPKGHLYESTWDNFNSRKIGCPECLKEYKKEQRAQQRQQIIIRIKKEIEEQGYVILSNLNEVYKKNTTKLELLCPQGHRCLISWSKFKEGQRCSICTKKKVIDQYKNNYEEVKNYIEKQGYKLLSTKYKNCQTKLDMICPKGHKCQISWNNFSKPNSSTRCASCSHVQSKPEVELCKIYSHLNPNAKDRITISPLELDLYFIQQSVAIEYCGLYWHSTKAPGDRINSSYHRHKLDLCKQRNIRLLTIFEDEWLQHKDICISRIDNALGLSKKRIYARKCTAKEIVKLEAKEFLNQNHLQGYKGCRVAFGLFYQDNLIQVMTFGLPSRAHTSKGKRVLEMKRLASKHQHSVVGGAGKLFKLGLQYAKYNDYEIIKSYCDLRWGTGNLYKQLGFTKTYETKYTPHYTDCYVRYRNQSLATNKKKEDTTESKKAKQKQLYKIYDCGHQTWEYNIS